MSQERGSQRESVECCQVAVGLFPGWRSLEKPVGRKSLAGVQRSWKSGGLKMAERESGTVDVLRPVVKAKVPPMSHLPN